VLELVGKSNAVIVRGLHLNNRGVEWGKPPAKVHKKPFTRSGTASFSSSLTHTQFPGREVTRDILFVSTMASKGAVLPLLRQELRATSRSWRASSSFSAHAPPARRPAPFASQTRAHGYPDAVRRRCVHGHLRQFSHSARSRQTEKSSFDPSQIEREADDVDVCIVGGGKKCRSLNANYHFRGRSLTWNRTLRSFGPRCCHSSETTRK
jgi:hypothetical protein